MAKVKSLTGRGFTPRKVWVSAKFFQPKWALQSPTRLSQISWVPSAQAMNPASNLLYNSCSVYACSAKANMNNTQTQLNMVHRTSILLYRNTQWRSRCRSYSSSFYASQQTVINHNGRRYIYPHLWCCSVGNKALGMPWLLLTDMVSEIITKSQIGLVFIDSHGCLRKNVRR